MPELYIIAGPNGAGKTTASANISNLLKVFINLCDVWMLYDNSDLAPILIAKGADQSEIEIINETTFNLINRYVEE